MSCSQCNFENRPGAQFCKRCGAPLAEATPAGARRICAHCGASLKPAARFCARCGQPAPDPVPSESPATPRAGEADEAKYTQPAYSVEPPMATDAMAPPPPAARRLPRWLIFAGVGTLILCLAFALVLLLVWQPFSGRDGAAPPDEPEISATATITATAEALPTATALPPMPNPLRREAHGDGVILTLSENPVQAGGRLTITVVFTNTGDAFARDVRVYLTQAGAPLFEPPESTVAAAEGEIAPGERYTGTFVLVAQSEGVAPVEASINWEWNVEPPAPDLRRVGPLDVEVTP